MEAKVGSGKEGPVQIDQSRNGKEKLGVVGRKKNGVSSEGGGKRGNW